MENNLIILPKEVEEIAIKTSDEKQVEVRAVLNQIFVGTDDWEKQVDAIVVKDIHDKMSIDLAETARKNAKNARLSAEKVFDLKRSDVQQKKQEFDIEDKLWLKAKQVMQLRFQAIENKAEYKANFIKRHEAEQKELRTQNRALQVEKFAQINRIEFESMSDESFDSFLSGLEAKYLAKIETERKAEEERVAFEIAEKKRQDEARRKAEELAKKQAVENALLKKQAEAREAEMKKQREEAQQKIDEEIKKAQKQKEIADKAYREAQLKFKEEQEKAIKLQQELLAKNEAIKKQKDLENQEKIAQQKAELEKLRAPKKEQMKNWVNSFKITEAPIKDDPILIHIENKFNAFKKWAISEIEK